MTADTLPLVSEDVTPGQATGPQASAATGSPIVPGSPAASGYPVTPGSDAAAAPAAGYESPGYAVSPPPAQDPHWNPGDYRAAPEEPTVPFEASPQHWQQTSGPPYPWPSAPASPDPHGLGPSPVDPLSGAGFGGSPYARRIEPSPPPPRRKLFLGLAVGLVAGLLVFGTAGFLVGRGSVDERPVATPTPVPSYVAGVIADNESKLTGELAVLAKPWIADISGCAGETDPGGPQLGPGERRHVLCRAGGMYLHFVTYVSADEKGTDRSYRQQLALGTGAILAGSEQPARKLGGSTGAPGTYVEYATRGPKSPALCGVWWDLDDSASSVYVDVLCESLGGKWDPLRAMWQLHS
jgi:hypothetical protein